MKAIKNICILVVVAIFATSCDKVYLDPNSTLEPDVTNSTDNLTNLVNGIQQRWSSERTGLVYALVNLSGLNTGELQLLNAGNIGENQALLGGGDIGGNNELLNNIWTNAMLCRKEATTVINSADGATDDTSIASTLKAYGLFYRALVHGTLIQYFEQIPITIEENAAFTNRASVLQNAIAELTEAKGLVSSGLSTTVTSKLIGSVDLINSINALLARYNLMAGNYTDAITAANLVDTSVKSTWKYDAAIPNPLAFWFGSNNVTQAKNLNFGLPANLLPDAADARVPFYVKTATAEDGSTNYSVAAFFDDNLDEIPLYLPGEMMLIKAEVYARLDDLDNAKTALDTVLTKTTDAYGIGAALPAYTGAETKEALLDEIYKNRRIELFLSGLSLEDTRRFNRPGAGTTNAERNRDYYPYPNAERDNNTNTPANPTS